MRSRMATTTIQNGAESRMAGPDDVQQRPPVLPQLYASHQQRSLPSIRPLLDSNPFASPPTEGPPQGGQHRGFVVGPSSPFTSSRLSTLPAVAPTTSPSVVRQRQASAHRHHPYARGQPQAGPWSQLPPPWTQLPLTQTHQVQGDRVASSSSSWSFYEPPRPDSSAGQQDERTFYHDSSSQSDEERPASSSSSAARKVSLREQHPQLWAKLNKVFVPYCDHLCSHPDARTSTGELIQQAYMSSKAQRLDSMQVFRPFRFRIQAFSAGFMEALREDAQKSGRADEALLPHKTVREFLWNHPLISRFNHDGKKAKSKGNHVWSLESRLCQDGSREYKSFDVCVIGVATNSARIGSPMECAHVGYRWSFTPRLWSPHSPMSDLKDVRFESPELPDWLRWEGNTLSGVPSTESPPVEIVTVATLPGSDTTQPDKVYRHSLMLSVLGHGSSSRRTASSTGGR